MLSRILFLSFLFLFTFFSLEVKAQDCYKKALEKGRKFQLRGEKDKARKAWEKARACPGADTLELANLIRSLDDFDLDGILDMVDVCKEAYGAKSRNGCPCAEPYRQQGIDFYFDNQLDSARHYYDLAMSCDEAEGLSSLKDFGQIIASDSIPYPNESDKKIFGLDEVDIKPEFPLGEQEMFIYMYSRIKYPPLAVENGVDGTALIEFIVEKDGSLSHYRIRNGLSHGIGEESLRMAKLFSKFKPGQKNGHPVRVLYILPVKFKLV